MAVVPNRGWETSIFTSHGLLVINAQKLIIYYAVGLVRFSGEKSFHLVCTQTLLPPYSKGLGMRLVSALLVASSTKSSTC